MVFGAHAILWMVTFLLLVAALLSLLQIRIAGRRRWFGLAAVLAASSVATAAINVPTFRTPGSLPPGKYGLIVSALLLLAAILVVASLISAGSLIRRLRNSLDEVQALKAAGERALRQYELIADTISDAFVILQNGHVRFANRAFFEILGRNRAAVLGHSFQEVIDPSGRFFPATDATHGIQHAGTDDVAGPTCLLYTTPAGKQRWFELRITPVNLPDDTRLEIALIRDVSGERQAANLRQVLYEMTVEAQRTREPEELFATLQRVLDRVMDARNLFVALYDKNRDELTFPFYRDELAPTAPAPMPPGKTLTGYVLRKGQPLFVDSEAFRNLHERGEVELVGPDSQDWMGVPLVIHGETAGVLAVQSYSTESRFGEYEQALLTVVAGHLAHLLEIKEAERAVRESERHYRALFDHSPTGIFHFDRQLRITDCNDRLADILGSSRDRLLGLDLNELQDRQVVPPLKRTLTGTEESYEGWYRPTTGHRTAWLSMRTAPILDEDGRVSGGVALVEDQTAARLAEEELRRRDAIIETLSRVGHRFLSCRDMDEVIVTALAELGAAAGADRIAVCRFVEPQAGQHDVQTVHSWTGAGVTPEQPASAELADAATISRWFKTLRNGQPLTGPVREFPEQEQAPLSRHGLLSLALIPIPLAERWWGFMAFEDHHRERHWSNPEIEALRLVAATMGAALHHRVTEQRLRTAEKMEAIGQLASGIAHDFNNLLMAIRFAVEQLLQEPELQDTRISENLSIIDRAADQAATMTKRLLAFSRRQIIEPQPLNLNELLQQFLPTARRVLPENIDISFIPGAAVPPVLADPGQIEQILMNLLINSRDAMPSGGTITVETDNILVNGAFISNHPWAREGRYVLLALTDTGHGMSQETLAHAFEPFFTTKKAGKGTGMGLATVYGIVKQHRGMIHLYSEVDHGTTVKVYLPTIDRPATTIRPASQGPIRGGTETLLLVEDDANVRKAVKELLTSLGYTVLVAEDGRRALETLEERAPSVQLVLTDVIMPNMDGKELADEAARRWPHLRFLFMTGYSENAIHKDFVKLDGISFLMKPFGRDELARKVRSMLQEGDGPPGATGKE